MLIGTGAILPGVSGGALAAVFGLYEKIIAFIAHLTRDFKKNFLYFFPVGLGGVFGIFLLSFALSFFLEYAEAQILWFFIGCILGILPALFKQAAKRGRTYAHLGLTAVTAALMLFVLLGAKNLITSAMPQNFLTWVMAGGIFGLGLIVPGLSPSNFLVYLGMYKPMTDAIKSLDFSVILPVLLGAALVILSLSKLINFIFDRAYASMYHFIIGVVIASTIMIAPTNYNYMRPVAVTCLIACFLGVFLGLWMSSLEEKYKPEN